MLLLFTPNRYFLRYWNANNSIPIFFLLWLS